MQYSKWLWIVAVLFIYLPSNAQLKEYSIGGVINSIGNEPLPFATIQISKLNIKIRANESGRFEIFKVPQGDYDVKISAVGYHSLLKSIQVPSEGIESLSIYLTADEALLENVAVIGYSAAQQTNKLAYNVTAINAKKLHNYSVDVGQVINKISGVKVRESGGLGSQANISLNGFSGNQVKIFMDGLPMDNYGSSFQLNNIPINYVDQIEVYKGVVPVWLGGDALGGAINLIKSTSLHNYLDVSYSYGSFNTHRATINAGFINKNGFTMELNAYKNYSDNNYWVEVDVVPDINSGVTVKDRVRRFHDMYKNQMLSLNIGVSNKAWADQLLVGMNVGDDYADIQTGNRMAEVYGARFRKGNLLQPTFQFRKTDLFTKGLNASLRASFNLGEEKTVDTVYRRFNWYGGSVPKGNNSWDPGGERSRELYVYKNNNGNAALNISYDINAKNRVLLNNTFVTANRKGNNQLQPDNDFYRQPKITQKNITGIGWANTLFDKLDNNLFLKYYYQHVKAYSVYNDVYTSKMNNSNHLGYGLATSYRFSPNTQLKLSFEKTYRLPELNELFGDVINLEANPNLRPESSNNFNVGINKYFIINSKNAINVNAGIIYRYAKDYIRYVLSSVNFDGAVRQVAQNQRDVNNFGFDVEARYSYNQRLFIGGNITYQNLRNMTKYETSTTDVSIFYKDRLPNIPFLFGTADASYTWQNLLFNRSKLTIGYSLVYVHDYYLRWPSAGSSEKEMIPKQLSHDVSLNYAIADGKYNIGIEGRNITDEILYDNYMLQKPSRNFSIKFRYTIKK